jgi:hypothetical protein
VFIASVPALGVKTYLIKPISALMNLRKSDRTSSSVGRSILASVELYTHTLNVEQQPKELFTITATTYSKESLVVENTFLKLAFDGQTGYLQVQ